MGKKFGDTVLDSPLTKIKTECIKMRLCSETEPGSLATAIVDTLASAVLASTDFYVVDGTVDGRMATTATQSDLTIDTTGTAGHVVLDDGTTMQVISTNTPQVVTSGGTVTINPFNMIFRDPT